MTTTIDDIRFDLKHLDDKLTEFNRMYQNLGTRVDNQQLRTEMWVRRSGVRGRKRAIRDIDSIQSKLNTHLDEMEQYVKSKSKDVVRFFLCKVYRTMLKQLSELRRNKELKSRQIETIITKAEEFMKSNPPQVAK